MISDYKSASKVHPQPKGELSMKLLIVLFFLLPSIAVAGTFTKTVVESQNLGEPVLLTVLSFVPKTGKIGTSTFFQVAPGWAQATFGPTWSPAKGRQIGMRFGLEQRGKSYGLRYAGFGWFAQGPISGILIIEGNQTLLKGFWYDAWLRYSPTSQIAVGLHARRFAGSGMEIYITIPETKVSAYCAWLPLNQEEGTFNPTASLIGVALEL